MEQIIGQCASALPGLLEVVPESMRHDCHSDGLDVFREEHFTAVH